MSLDQNFDPSQFERPFWEPLGQFVIKFGYLEMRVDWAIGGLLRVHDRQGEAVASQITSLRARVRLIEKLAYLLTSDGELRQRMTEIVNGINEQNTYRNRLVHGPWGSYIFDPKETYWQKLSVGQQDLKYKTFEVRLSDLSARVKRIQELDSDLVNHTQAIVADRMKRDESASSREEA